MLQKDPNELLANPGISALGGGCHWPQHRATRTYTGLGKQTLGGHKQNLVHNRTQEKGAATPQEIDPDLLWVSRSLWWRWGSAEACCRVRGTEGSSPCMGGFKGGCLYLHYLHQSLASGQVIGREHSPTHQQKIGLNIYWEWPSPSGQDQVYPSVSLSHQEASISLLSFLIRRQTGWKPQSLKTSQSNHRDHSLV